MMRSAIAVVAIAALGLQAVLAQTDQRCGVSFSANNQPIQLGVCTNRLGPCCSESNYCGETALHCAGGCQPRYSYSVNDTSKAPCLVYREGLRRCISGMYRFGPGTNDTWWIPLQAYNGNPLAADFTIERGWLNLGNVIFPTTGGVALRVTQGENAATGGYGARIASTSYMTGGKVTARLRQSGIPGIVTSFILMSDEKDEIDWEWTGASRSRAESNYFSDGVPEYTRSGQHYLPNNASTVDVAHEYSIEWDRSRITWSIDNRAVRTVDTAQAAREGKRLPTDTAMRVQVAIWDATSSGRGTLAWAGAPNGVSWAGAAQQGGYYAFYEWIKVQCPGDPEPTGPPQRPAGYAPPSPNAPDIKSVIEDSPNFVPGTVGENAPLPAAAPSSPQGIVAINPNTSQPVTAGATVQSSTMAAVTFCAAILAVLAMLF